MIIGLIPARGGSKGIPGKNLSVLGGKTLLARGVELLKNAKCDLVYVSSEDDFIIAEALLAEAQIIRRPLEISSDESETKDVVIHAISYLNLKANDIIVLHQVTSPLLRVENVKLCIGELLENLTLNSVVTIHKTHPFMWEQMTDAYWSIPINFRTNLRRRQDLGVMGHETGGIYAARVGAILEQKNLSPSPTNCISVDYLEALDIDNYEDLENARKIIKD